MSIQHRAPSRLLMKVCQLLFNGSTFNGLKFNNNENCNTLTVTRRHDFVGQIKFEFYKNKLIGSPRKLSTPANQSNRNMLTLG